MQRSLSRLGFRFAPAAVLLIAVASTAQAAEPSTTVDFNREIRSILSNKCFQCHGPDENERQADLRLDNEAGAHAALVPGKPSESELIRRIASSDPDEAMPPPAAGKKLSPREVELLTKWVEQGGRYATHWAYVKPVRPALPQTTEPSLRAWPKNEVDHFILARLLEEGLLPSPEADRHALIRRVSLDLTGMPPTPAEVAEFVGDSRPDAFEQLVDRLLAKETYGEHWARLWLDLARYADSTGYADDPARTIWAYRDYVIRSLNANKPFDQFTIEQIAGDLLPEPTEDQLIATAFHRNTQTNNEGGTNDEEFRSVAVVDRVNTTMAVWMGTTMACAQCHTHKYDPISQEEYFRFLAIFNNTADADRRDETPVLEIYTAEQKRQKADWESEIRNLENVLQTPTPELLASQSRWEQAFAAELEWLTFKPGEMKSQSGTVLSALEDNSILAASPQKTDVYTVDYVEQAALLAASTVPETAESETTEADEDASPAEKPFSALRLEVLPHESLPASGPGHAGGNFVVTRVAASITPPDADRLPGRYVRIEIPGPQKILSLAEVQVFSGDANLAPTGEASQSSTAFEGPAGLAVDGNTNGNYSEAKSTTHTAISDNPWWELDLKAVHPLDRIVVWNRTDNGLHVRLAGFRIAVLNEKRETVWEQTVADPPNPNSEYALSGTRAVAFAAVIADHTQSGFNAADVLDNKDPATKGWAIGGQLGKAHSLTLIPTAPVSIAAGSKLTLTIEQLSKQEQHTVGRFRFSATTDARAAEFARTPENILALLKAAPDARTEPQRTELSRYYLGQVAPELKKERDRLAKVKQQLAGMKPTTTVPIFRELAEAERRKTQIQYRGNFLDLGPEVAPGVPAAFHPLPEGAPINRLTLAQWLVDENNPLTARVIVNRFWEKIFGIGIVATSEEFGSQGELPSHPELLDWLATELVQQKWDTKAFLKLLVTSAAYRQSSRVTPELLELDPDNRLLARGPRFRLSAEMIRDQALFVSGLLSPKMYGPPVKPPQPSLGLNAAFGGAVDWQTSDGEDKYRRGLYTTWRRSSPYPSMATFDAPNREVCIVRRDRTNTPLQALVTLNDPVYVEAAQSLARGMAAREGTPAEKVAHAFALCLSRSPNDTELSRLVQLYERAHLDYSQSPSEAQKLASTPLGPLPEGADAVSLAAWTVVGNVLLNLDEMFMRR